MHETTIAQSVLETAAAKLNCSAQKMEAEKISLLVGEFRNVDPESLIFAFNALKADYVGFRTSELEIELVSLTAICQGDGHTYHAKASQAFCCPQCNRGIDQIITGKELDIVGITARSI